MFTDLSDVDIHLKLSYGFPRIAEKRMIMIMSEGFLPLQNRGVGGVWARVRTEISKSQGSQATFFCTFTR